jgi:HSP20 family protein
MHEDPMDMFDEMDEMFARLFSRMNRDFSAGPPQVTGYRIVWSNGGASSQTAELPPTPLRATDEPVAEVHQIGDETRVITELPGVTDETIRLDVKGNTLLIDAGDADRHYRTSAALPPVDPASMQRSFKNGVLEVTFRNLPDARKTPEANRN